ncbi:hypothetical protein EDE04_3088 [Streptomyces sp. 2132.2]|uniref:Uncharacterized protein n=2 Tax=Streptomyces vinaceus TaxID=1960 RepID=A0A5J6J5N9_STRVI|nr:MULTISPECIES: hypothetical protein [Streptomyces]QEV46229.1 hypothetical protein CP980_14970 [Streptomyces vinaceus]ROQ96625.1 hypothetical protein EDE04_3088 [Streptomyces sp. 2132.2]GHE75433.1 hypothetical protein GCM10017778_71400 [Streptomyces vinaceus]
MTPATLRERTLELAKDLDTGDWMPTDLERVITRRLLTAADPVGCLTDHAVRDAVWEGSEPLTRASDGRLSLLLAEITYSLAGNGRDAAGLASAQALLASVNRRGHSDA